MKTYALPAQAILAAIVAVIVLPVGAAAACAAVTATGVLGVLAADYGRALEPVRVQAEVVPFNAPNRPAVEQRQAA